MSLPAGQGILQLQLLASKPERIYHARRAHRKSRAGCAKCKQRRVKCDESKPHCVRCQKLHLDCSYEPINTNPEQAVTRFLTSSPDSRAYSMGLDAVGAQIHKLLQLPAGASPSVRVQALHHFYELSDPALGPHAVQADMQRQVIQQGFESPFLMHAIIASATSHLRSTTTPDQTLHHSRAATEAYHWHHAITGYAAELPRIGPQNMDGLFSACLLLTLRSFELEHYDPLSSFVFSSDPSALNWLTLQVGLRRLLEATVPWQTQSMWWDVFMESAAKHWAIFEDHPPSGLSLEGLDPRLAELCGIDERTSAEGNVYYEPVRMLSGLLRLQPRGIRSLVAYTGWMGRLEQGFFDCLLRKEPPALVVLRAWLELLGTAELWWLGNRVRSEVQAITWFLEGLGL
ncbi:Zn(II)2Cys6 transcription factor domain-containing protein [Aspergillus homomorphus CBS 101889]|uniref:Zn(2)-C6 fungal-type domain-containing protein n=1 Tax=Aspergillus homomorphus (strain CBS 101889) TaxID=1450537 RepID=A0A395HV20_ASPHC|nr:hypothetical protein BO97DRAFT_370871 [Aspergillus homomorphus CBS 101889]RAL11379.1 hypothetical protein BO97DRAFT_370871 [Aspergillus homomorphus CBS 101889]